MVLVILMVMMTRMVFSHLPQCWRVSLLWAHRQRRPPPPRPSCPAVHSPGAWWWGWWWWWSWLSSWWWQWWYSFYNPIFAKCIIYHQWYIIDSAKTYVSRNYLWSVVFAPLCFWFMNQFATRVSPLILINLIFLLLGLYLIHWFDFSPIFHYIL